MKWLKDNLKFGTLLFWLLSLIIGIIFAMKGFGFILLIYSAFMLIGNGISHCGKYFSIDFTTRRWYLVSITMAILWFITALFEIGIQAEVMPISEDILHQIEIFKNALLTIAVITFFVDKITRKNL